jgi:hypothetical protein
MDKQKQKVNVKTFLQNYRSGLPDAELMRIHGLTAPGLSKLLKVLQDRELLHASEVRVVPPSGRGADTAESPQVRSGVRELEPDEAPDRTAEVSDSGFHCPQCGATVNGKVLTCPECGHVLPGEERWSNLEPDKSFVHRLPGWVIGCAIALPLAVALLFVFKYVLVPMSSASIQQRTKAQGGPMPARRSLEAARELAGKGSTSAIQKETERLTSEGVLAAASSDYSSFTVTNVWPDLSREQRIKHLVGLVSALQASGFEVRFQVFNSSGDLAARVAPPLMDLVDKDGYTDSVDRAEYESIDAGSAGE